MDRWEQHFIEKSGRRFEAEALERRRQRVRTAITIVVATIIFLGAVISLAVLP